MTSCSARVHSVVWLDLVNGEAPAIIVLAARTATESAMKSLLGVYPANPAPTCTIKIVTN